MSQVFVASASWINSSFFIEGSEAHHLVHVIRKKIGDEIEIFDGQGRQVLGKLTLVQPNPLRVEGKVIRELPVSPKKIRLHLYQGLPRGSKFDLVLEKATELGVDAVIPFLSKKNIIKLTPAQSEPKVKRWNAVVKAAAKQSGRPDLPTVEFPRNLLEWSDRFKAGPTFVLWEKEKSATLETVLVSKPNQATVSIIIGPESGFTEDEIAALVRLGVKPVGLGTRILRTETAGLAVLSILNYAWDLF